MSIRGARASGGTIGVACSHPQETTMSPRLMIPALALVAGISTAFAADPPKRSLDLAQAIELIAKTYPGRVIAAQADPTGGDALHYHVDVLLANGRVAKFDVDARTQRIYNRMPPEESPETTLTLADAVKKVQSQTRGRVLSAEYDPDPRPHYHMNVRGPKGQLTRLDLDIATGKAAPHRPRT
jgi:uncharacterized membrane protein YkoI